MYAPELIRGLLMYSSCVSHDWGLATWVPGHHRSGIVYLAVHHDPAIVFLVVFLYFLSGELLLRSPCFSFCCLDLVDHAWLHPASIAGAWFNRMPEQHTRAFL